MSKEVLFTINGFDVLKNSRYVVKNKPDYNAPTGFQKLGTTKITSDGVSASFQCGFDEANKIWDTGFYTQSPCYASLTETERANKVSTLEKGLLKGYKEKVGIPLKDTEALGQRNNNFWDKINILLEPDFVFDTTDYQKAFELYLALLGKKIAPKGKESDPAYSEAFYVIVDASKDLKVQEENANAKFSAIGSFMNLMKTDRNKLVSVLRYLNLTVTEKTPDPAMNVLFEAYLSAGNDRIIRFNKVIEESETVEGGDKLVIFNLLKDKFGKDKKLQKNPKGMFTYEGIELGMDLHSATEAVLYRLPDIKKELLISDDN